MEVTIEYPEYPEVFPFIKVSGTSYEMGKQRGRLLKDLIKNYMHFFLGRCAKVIEHERQREEFLRLQDTFEKYTPDLLEEMKGIADGSGYKYEDILVMNLASFPGVDEAKRERRYRGRSDYPNPFVPDCTAFGATGPATADGQTLVGKNWTAGYTPTRVVETYPYRVIVFKNPSDGIPHVQDSSPAGPFGEDGMNAEGLVQIGSGIFCLDGVKAFRDGKPSGIPINFLNHETLSTCSCVDEALKKLEKIPRGYGGRGMVVADKENIVRVEVSYEKIHVKWPEIAGYPANYVMASANNYSSKEMNQLGLTKEQYYSSYKRYERAMEILTSEAGKITFETMKRISRDHVNGPSKNSICRHGRREDPIVCTHGSMIAQPHHNRVWTLAGIPCQKNWTPFLLE